ncbi:MAG: hypothetical protein LQ342_001154 [Letrouitia transgressa]|nr:MAG: hypothetical protein LQ342_001154 [Letrouitia transgressa]
MRVLRRGQNADSREEVVRLEFQLVQDGGLLLCLAVRTGAFAGENEYFLTSLRVSNEVAAGSKVAAAAAGVAMIMLDGFRKYRGTRQYVDGCGETVQAMEDRRGRNMDSIRMVVAAMISLVPQL